MPVRMSARVWRHKRAGSGYLTRMMRHGHGGSRGAQRPVCGMLEGRCAPGSRWRGLRDAGMQTHGCRWCATPWRTTIARAQACCLAGIDTGPGGGPHTHDDVHRYGPGRTAAHERCRGAGRWRLAIDGGALPDQQADGSRRDGTAGMEKAAMPDLHQALGQDVREDPAEQRQDVQASSAEACTAPVPGGAGDRAVCEADETVGGERALEARGGQGRKGGMALVMGPTMDMPGEGPGLRVDVLQETSVTHRFFAEGTGEGGEGFDGAKEVCS
jgi:hypothetical protein